MYSKILRLFGALGTLSLILMIILSNLSSAEVDVKRPNLSRFKLKSAKNTQQTSESIVDLASGAKYLHESLFVSDKIVRCSSYAHLFKIIKQQQQPNSIKRRNSERIKQNVVEALAITAADEKELYKSLFERGLRTTVPENFLEATRLLETPAFNNDKHGKGAWLDLISCMSEYMQNYGKIKDPAILEFLRKEERSEALKELKKQEATMNNSAVPTTAGLVSYMRQKIAGDTTNGRSVYGRFMGNKVLDESSKLVASFDDETSQKARANYMNKYKFDDSSSSINSSGGPKSRDFLDDKLNGIKEPMPDYDYQYSNESNQDQSFASAPTSTYLPGGGEFNELKMEHLEAVKGQLDKLESDSKSPRIDMRSAIDFLIYFEDLDSAGLSLDPASDLGKRAILFHQEPMNRQLLARVKAVVGKYVQLISVLAELKIQEDRWNSVDSDLRPQLDRLESSLGSFDPAFDVEKIREEFSFWKAKCSEYAAIHQFIKTD